MAPLHLLLSLTGAVHRVQISGTHELQFGQKGMPTVSLLLPKHHHAILPASLHNWVPITSTGLSCTSLLVVAATSAPNHLGKWASGLPHPLPCPMSHRLHQHMDTLAPASPKGDIPRPDIVTLNVQLSLRPKLRVFDALLGECHFPVAVHLQDSGPQALQTVHRLYQMIQVPPAQRGDAPSCSSAPPYMTVTCHDLHPSGRTLFTYSTVAATSNRTADEDLGVI